MISTLLLTTLLSQDPVLVTGYFDTRLTGTAARVNGAAGFSALLDGNVQVKAPVSSWLTLQLDSSLTSQSAAFFRGDLPADAMQVVIAEAYADFSAGEHFRFLLGKKRVVWGSGLSFNPTDVVSPPKDPTDPTAQRAGAWMAMVETPFKWFTVSALFAVRTTRTYAGLPTALLFDPEGNDTEPHLAAAARFYTLVADTDVTLTYSFTHLYADARTTDSRVGLSLSRSFGDLELHAELAGYLGSTRMVVDGSSITRPDLEARFINGRALVGGRYQFEDSSMLSAEYFFNGDGEDPDSFKSLVKLALTQPKAFQAALGASTNPGTPQRFSFDALRRHYASLSYSKPRIFDDFTASLSALISLEDLSTQLVPQLQWQAQEWFLLTLAAYVPLSGVKSLGVEVGNQTLGELSLSVFGTRVVLSMRAYF